MTSSHGNTRASIRRDATTFTLERPVRPLSFARVPASTLGAIWAVYGDRGLESIAFERETLSSDAREQRRAPDWLAAPLAAYFRGEPVDFRGLPIAPHGTDFQQRVWAALRDIPWGHVVSYANIATRVGIPRGMRAVGLANGRNPIPIVVPCHRVVEASGRIGGYTGGLDRKVALLALEGVRVEKDRVLPGQLPLFGASPP